MLAPLCKSLMLAAVVSNGCAASDPPPARTSASSASSAATSVASGTLPLQLCLRTGDRALEAIRTGEVRLLLELRSAALSRGYKGQLTLRLLDAYGRSRWEEEFGMHAGQLDASGKVLAQRFQFHLRPVPADAVRSVAGDETLCFELHAGVVVADVPAPVVLEAKLHWQE